MLSKHTFIIWRKKGSDFFDHRGTLNTNPKWRVIFKLTDNIWWIDANLRSQISLWRCVDGALNKLELIIILLIYICVILGKGGARSIINDALRSMVFWTVKELASPQIKSRPKDVRDPKIHNRAGLSESRLMPWLVGRGTYVDAPPRGPTPYPFIYHFDRKGTPFMYLLLKKGTGVEKWTWIETLAFPKYWMWFCLQGDVRPAMTTISDLANRDLDPATDDEVRRLHKKSQFLTLTWVVVGHHFLSLIATTSSGLSLLCRIFGWERFAI